MKVILNYSPGSTENTNWHMALYAHNKPFVAHHHFQNFHREKITGSNYRWDNFFPIVKCLIYPYSILLSLTFPVVVVFDAIFRDADLLFLTPEALRDRPTQQLALDRIQMVEHQGEEQRDQGLEIQEDDLPVVESKLMAFFRTNIHRPIYRIVYQQFMDIIFLISLGLSLTDPLDEGKEVPDRDRTKELHFYDYFTAVLVVSNLFDSVLELASRRWHSISSYWKIYNILSYLLLFGGGLTYYLELEKHDNDIRANLSGNDIVNVGATFFAIGASMAFLTPLHWFLLNRSLGPVVVCIIKVLKDAFHIFLIFIVVFVAFAIPCYFLFKPFSTHSDEYFLHQDDLVTLRGLFGAMFWRVFDAGQPHFAAIMLNNTIDCNKTENTNENDEFDVNCLSEEFSHVMSMAMWAVYQAITVILLLNILIAMMNTTYTRIWKIRKALKEK